MQRTPLRSPTARAEHDTVRGGRRLTCRIYETPRATHTDLVFVYRSLHHNGILGQPAAAAAPVRVGPNSHEHVGHSNVHEGGRESRAERQADIRDSISTCTVLTKVGRVKARDERRTVAMVKATLTTSADWAKLAPRPRDSAKKVSAHDLKRLFGGGVHKNPARRARQAEPTNTDK